MSEQIKQAVMRHKTNRLLHEKWVVLVYEVINIDHKIPFEIEGPFQTESDALSYAHHSDTKENHYRVFKLNAPVLDDLETPQSMGWVGSDGQP